MTTDPAHGLPVDLRRVLRDQRDRRPGHGRVRVLAAWNDAPSNTPSAELPAPSEETP